VCVSGARHENGETKSRAKRLEQLENDPTLLDRVLLQAMRAGFSNTTRKPNTKAHNGCLHTPPPDTISHEQIEG